MSFSQDYEFRPIANKDERDQFDSLVQYVFANTSTEPPELESDLKNEWTTAAFHKGKVVATSAGYEFKMRLNGKAIQVDGVTEVGTNPGFRRKGLVRELITRRLHGVHEDPNQCGAILWASMGAIYQRFGYGLGSHHFRIRFDPRMAQFQYPGEVDGYVSQVNEKEGTPIVKSLYRQDIEDRSLALHRVDIMWHGTFGTKKRRAYCAVYFNSDDKPEGFISYSTDGQDNPPVEGGPNQKLVVRDFVYKNIQAYRGLWEFMRAHDLVYQVEFDAPRDDPAFHMLLEPRSLKVDLWDNIWFRLVDVDQALANRCYGLPAKVCIEIKEDPECPWNVRKYLVETDGESTEVKVTQNSADFTISVNGLASLLSGNSSLSILNRIGRAEVQDHRRLATLDSLFATKRAPFCNDFF